MRTVSSSTAGYSHHDSETVVWSRALALSFFISPYRKRWGKRVVTGHPHNEYLELAADYGWIGFGLFAAAWMATWVKLIVSAHRAQEASSLRQLCGDCDDFGHDGAFF